MKQNYRSISLLSSIYKIFAAIFQKSLSDTIDEKLQKVQYGFRIRKSTAQAIHLIRRIIGVGKRADKKISLVLIDWENAFDKVSHEGLSIAMERMNIAPKLTTGEEKSLTHLSPGEPLRVDCKISHMFPF